MVHDAERPYIPSGLGHKPERRPHVYSIVCPRPRESHVVGVILSNRWLKVWTHYIPSPDDPDRGTPAPHFEPRSHCEGCKLTFRKERAKFYAPAFLEGNGRVAILELCEGTPNYEPRMIDPSFDWRLQFVQCWRVGVGKKTRTSLEILRKATAKYPNCPPITPSLENLWGMRDNTLPAKWNEEIRGAV